MHMSIHLAQILCCGIYYLRFINGMVSTIVSHSLFPIYIGALCQSQIYNQVIIST